MKKLLLLTSFIIYNSTFIISYAQPGSLDLDFDADGKLTTDFDVQTDQANAVVVQPDGKIIVAGYSLILTDDDFSMARYNTDGTLDLSFGGDGKVTTNFTAVYDRATAILLQPDGKIILAGTVMNTDYDFALSRFNSNGSPDNTFSFDGKETTDFALVNNQCNAAALQPDGKIILAGYVNNPNSKDFALIRYNSDGTLDTGFDADGKVSTSFGNSTSASINSIALQTDGKIVAAGYYTDVIVPSCALARYNADGSLDPTFSVDGKTITQAGTTASEIYSLTLQPNGYMLGGGYSDANAGNWFTILRYKTDGTLDTDFDGDGKATSESAGFNGQTTAVVLQPDGKIITSGISFVGSSNDFALVRFNANGTLDNTFGTSGTVLSPFSVTGVDMAFAAALQPDLKIVLAGAAYNGTDYDFAVARYLTGLNLGVLEFTANPSALVYPNPVNETTVLSFDLTNNETLTLTIYDAQGRKVKALEENKLFTAGKHEVSINASQLATGQYNLVIENATGKTVVKLVK